MQLITIIVQTSIKKQAKKCYFFEALTQANAVSSQALIVLRLVFVLVRDLRCEVQRIVAVLLYADFLREFVFYFLIAWCYYSKVMVESKAQSSKIARMVGLTASMS